MSCCSWLVKRPRDWQLGATRGLTGVELRLGSVKVAAEAAASVHTYVQRGNTQSLL